MNTRQQWENEADGHNPSHLAQPESKCKVCGKESDMPFHTCAKPKSKCCGNCYKWIVSTTDENIGVCQQHSTPAGARITERTYGAKCYAFLFPERDMTPHTDTPTDICQACKGLGESLELINGNAVVQRCEVCNGTGTYTYAKPKSKCCEEDEPKSPCCDVVTYRKYKTVLQPEVYCNKCDKVIPQPPATDVCQTCHGHGRYAYGETDKPVEVQCEVCNGTGKKHDEKLEEIVARFSMDGTERRDIRQALMDYTAQLRDENEKEWFQIIESFMPFHAVSKTDALKQGIKTVKKWKAERDQLKTDYDAIKLLAASYQQQLEEMTQYANKLAAGLPCLPADIENLREANLEFSMENLKLHEICKNFAACIKACDFGQCCSKKFEEPFKKAFSDYKNL